MIFEKLAYFAADELFPVIAHDLCRHSESAYDVVPNEIDDFLLPDLLVCLGFNPHRKLVHLEIAYLALPCLGLHLPLSPILLSTGIVVHLPSACEVVVGSIDFA